jgi:DNA mismatch repair protein MSH2
MVESTIDLNQIKNHLFLIKSTFDPDLKELKEKLDEIEEEIEDMADKVAADLDLPSKTVKLESNAQSGYYLRVSRKEDNVLRNNKKYTIIETRKDGIKFQNSKLERLNEQFIVIKENYEQQQKAVVDEVIKIACGYLDPLQSLNNLIAELDVYVSFAQVALSSQTEYVRPKLHQQGSGILKLKDARHPCLELQDGINFIPNDAEFVKDEKLFCIITGPNMGGKSTYIRQIGVLVLMAQIGSFVPASSAEITIVDCILARIGANDCQNKGVSTFMAEMLETSFILKTATSNSLVIVDELGRGTSTYDGFGLAWAISEYLVNKIKCFTLFATHFHELTALSEEIKTVYNCHVSALTTDENLTLLYKVKPGVCDQSFGIHVAKLANFPQHVIDYAKEKAKYLEDYCPLLSSEEEMIEDHSKKYKFKQETDAIIEKCFKKVQDIDASNLNDEEYIRKIHELILNESELGNNPYFKMLVNKL